MNKLTDKLKIILLVLPLTIPFKAYAAFSQSQLQQIVTTAAKIQFSDQEGNPPASKAAQGIAKKALPEAVANPGSVEEISRIFAAADPNTATTAITKAAITAVPAEISQITTAAVTAINHGSTSSDDLADSLAVEIIRTVIAVSPNPQKEIVDIVENQKPASPS
jgi:hypothetical protein